MTNSVILTGHLTRDIELRYMSDGRAVGSSGIGVNKKSKGQEKTSFFNFTAFGKTAENLNEICGKGSKVLIQGEIEQNQWTDKQNNKRSDVKIIVYSFEALSRRKEQAQQEYTPAQREEFHKNYETMEDDCPF